MSEIAVYRDDGPLAVLLGRRVGTGLPASGLALTVAGIVPLAAVATSAASSRIATGAAVGWLVLAAGAAAGRPAGRLGWLQPPLLRAVEYALLLWLAVHTAGAPAAAAFALLGVLAFHHYETVYRLRHQRLAPPRWLRASGGGWELRLLAAYALLLAGVLGRGLVVAAVVLAVLYAGESIASWLRFNAAARPALYEDREDEEQ